MRPQHSGFAPGLKETGPACAGPARVNMLRESRSSPRAHTVVYCPRATRLKWLFLSNAALTMTLKLG
ncbi:MAG: hypothetical protein LW822_09455, partial [Phycisphaeraceae bacterium]|nr:hypothetical protein [Phycisphaeraceae bacterium]